MTRTLVLILALLTTLHAADSAPSKNAKGRNPNEQTFDAAIIGATPAGIAAAIAAKRAGAARVALIEPSAHVGGRFAETIGFGEIDRMKPETVGGLWTELRAKVDAYYGKPTSTPEPHVQERILEDWLKEEGVSVLKNWRPARAEKSGAHLDRLIADDGQRIGAAVFIDATYYGDLLPLADVAFTIGRESRAQYGESLAGVLLKLVNPPGAIDLPVKSSPISGFAADGKTLLPHVHGLTTDVREGDGDTHLQCANLYVCLTKNPANRVELTAPENYDPAEFELLRREIARLGKDARFGFGGGVPADKAKMNDGVNYLLHWGLVSGADAYPAATVAERRRIWETHRDYTRRLLWFLREDVDLPEAMRQNIQQWGLPKDEFTDNGHWPYDLYAREGRRMISDFTMTQRDLFDDTGKADAIALGCFPVDSHAVRRLATPDGQEVINEGGYLVIPPIYEIPYRILTPKAAECDNLLVTCALSSSRVAFNSLRVEPTWMMIGQAAGTAAALVGQDKVPVQRVNPTELQKRLSEAGVPLQKP
ncbi:MAG: FAD-dependent oxidoreductase [Prosthecobacter sp.]|uniref:FAD-dependent oxidoreductase n=1 Tax=Prosthecobacter sp. TaxID=1965333 RepID=UPI0025DB99BB|nr:FAD-dependent oxidoreductase [Prosthecobacter sp.]MCF7784530.1 FAD-dependent oxidoreductase [Prosthecobacter sp.]